MRHPTYHVRTLCYSLWRQVGKANPSRRQTCSVLFLHRLRDYTTFLLSTVMPFICYGLLRSFSAGSQFKLSTFGPFHILSFVVRPFSVVALVAVSLLAVLCISVTVFSRYMVSSGRGRSYLVVCIFRSSDFCCCTVTTFYFSFQPLLYWISLFRTSLLHL